MSNLPGIPENWQTADVPQKVADCCFSLSSASSHWKDFWAGNSAVRIHSCDPAAPTWPCPFDIDAELDRSTFQVISSSFDPHAASPQAADCPAPVLRARAARTATERLAAARQAMQCLHKDSIDARLLMLECLPLPSSDKVAQLRQLLARAVEATGSEFMRHASACRMCGDADTLPRDTTLEAPPGVRHAHSNLPPGPSMLERAPAIRVAWALIRAAWQQGTRDSFTLGAGTALRLSAWEAPACDIGAWQYLLADCTAVQDWPYLCDLTEFLLTKGPSAPPMTMLFWYARTCACLFCYGPENPITQQALTMAQQLDPNALVPHLLVGLEVAEGLRSPSLVLGSKQEAMAVVRLMGKHWLTAHVEDELPILNGSIWSSNKHLDAMRESPFAMWLLDSCNAPSDENLPWCDEGASERAVARAVLAFNHGDSAAALKLVFPGLARSALAAKHQQGSLQDAVLHMRVCSVVLLAFADMASGLPPLKGNSHYWRGVAEALSIRADSTSSLEQQVHDAIDKSIFPLHPKMAELLRWIADKRKEVSRQHGGRGVTIDEPIPPYGDGDWVELQHFRLAIAAISLLDASTKQWCWQFGQCSHVIGTLIASLLSDDVDPDGVYIVHAKFTRQQLANHDRLLLLLADLISTATSGEEAAIARMQSIAIKEVRTGIERAIRRTRAVHSSGSKSTPWLHAATQAARPYGSKGKRTSLPWSRFFGFDDVGDESDINALPDSTPLQCIDRLMADYKAVISREQGAAATGSGSRNSSSRRGSSRQHAEQAPMSVPPAASTSCSTAAPSAAEGADKASSSPEPKQLKPCAQCGELFQKVHRCSGCRQVAYCGGACQRLHWAKHKVECKRLQAGNMAKQEAA